MRFGWNKKASIKQVKLFFLVCFFPGAIFRAFSWLWLALWTTPIPRLNFVDLPVSAFCLMEMSQYPLSNPATPILVLLPSICCNREAWFWDRDQKSSRSPSRSSKWKWINCLHIKKIHIHVQFTCIFHFSVEKKFRRENI